MNNNLILKLLIIASISFTSLAENNWPMSGGPNGNWQVNTEDKVPLEWSVRTGKNIKWRTELPEGGQSGIAVWGKRLFLTINPELNTEKFEVIEKKYQDLKKEYDAQYKETIEKLEGSPEYQNKQNAIQLAQKAYNKEWKLKSKDMSGPEKRTLKKKMEKSQLGIDLKNSQTDLFRFIHADKSFRKLQADMTTAERASKSGASSTDITLICMDADDGSILWQRKIKGLMASAYHYGFSDSTTPCPSTDGKHVWAINASGGMACFDFEGNEIWSRTWMPTGKRPFNKQFDSILHGNSILNVEPPEENDPDRIKEWNYLRAIDKNTGKTQWVCKDAITHYNAPVFNTMADGTPAVLIGRGGPHGVPERPVGLSMVSLAKENAGETIWKWEPKEENKVSGWGALSTQHWDINKAYWFMGSAQLSHISIDSQNGKVLDSKSLNNVDRYSFDKEHNSYKPELNFTLKKQDQSRHCNIIVGDKLLYLMRFAPFVVRHNITTGKTEVLELPSEIIRAKGKEDQYLYQSKESNSGLNSKGQRHAADSRTRGDGFQKCFLGSPTAINGKVFFTNALGLTYVLNADAEIFDEKALIAVNDLGARGETWTVASLTYANGNIFHRDLKAIICVE